MRVGAFSGLSAMVALLGAAGLGVASNVLAASATRAEPLVADLSKPRVKITTGFVGTEVVLFGATDGEGDVVVVVRGPAERAVVRRKDQIAGIYVNRRQMSFTGVPAFYAVAASGQLDDIVSPAVGARLEIGLEHLRLVAETRAPEEEVDEFRAALRRNKQRQGLYPAAVGKVTFLGSRLFRTEMKFPANVPTGEYEVLVYLLRGGQEVGAQITPLEVSKVGLEAEVFDFAHRNSALYGIIAIIIALAAGWLAGVVRFRKA